ncbi:hypothetical protein DYB26_016529, partial [Aphanomyces astaci]
KKFITEKYDPDVLKQAVAQHDQNHGSDASSHDDAVVECIRKLTERVIQVETLVMDLESRLRMQQHFQSMAVKHSPGMSASPSQSHMSRQTSIQRGMVARQPSVSALLAAPPSLSIMRASISKPSLHNGSGTALAGQTSGDAGMATGAASSLVTQLALDRSSSRRHISPVHPEWAPRGAARFSQLVDDGFFTNAAFFRYVPNFVVQWGLASDPARNTYAPIPDDTAVPTISNTVGTVSFATSGQDTRTTQLFVNFRNNSRLDSLGFTPFAVVTSGLDILVDHVYAAYRERPQQAKIKVYGDTYLRREFPLLTHIKTVSVVSPPTGVANE